MQPVGYAVCIEVNNGIGKTTGRKGLLIDPQLLATRLAALRPSPQRTLLSVKAASISRIDNPCEYISMAECSTSSVLLPGAALTSYLQPDIPRTQGTEYSVRPSAPLIRSHDTHCAALVIHPRADGNNRALTPH